MFNFGKKIFLGVDVGSSALKMAELEVRNGKPYLSNYAWMDIPENIGNNLEANSVFFETILPEYLKKMHREADFDSKDVFVSIPAFGGLMTLISFPAMPESDLEQAIRFEAHKYIPTSLDEVVISWEIAEGGEAVLPPNPKKEREDETGAVSKKKIKVLLVAASKSKIAVYEKAVKKAGLNLRGIEIENISMVHSLVGGDLGNFIIIDIGFKICNIIYVEKGIIKINRNLNAGGVDMTRTIAKSLGITEERAESMKKSDKNFFAAESSVQFPTMEIIMGEAIRIKELLSRDGKSFSPDAVILSGGTAAMTGLREFVAGKLGIKTIVGDPFSRVGHDKKIDPYLAKLKTSFSVSVGLALRGVDEYNQKK